MATDAEKTALIAYVGASASDATFAGQKVDEAWALVRRHMGDYASQVPAAIQQSAMYECAAKLWARKGAPNGQDSYLMDGTPMPIPRDPMVTAYPILDPFLPGGFA